MYQEYCPSLDIASETNFMVLIKQMLMQRTITLILEKLYIVNYNTSVDRYVLSSYISEHRTIISYLN